MNAIPERYFHISPHRHIGMRHRHLLLIQWHLRQLILLGFLL